MQGLALQVDDLVVVMEEGLREHAAGIAQQLRKAGRRVDLVLESKKMKWIFKVSHAISLLAALSALFMHVVELAEHLVFVCRNIMR